MKAILVHGGAGPWKDERLERALEGVKAAALAGWAALEEGKGALDAVIEAVAAMEDDPVFNAGTGAALNLFGQAELEASVMRGDTRDAGAVSGADVKNPVRLARLVMEETDHVILVGQGAVLFARAMGFPKHDPITPERVKAHRDLKKELLAGRSSRWKKLPDLLRHHPEFQGDTVGAVAVDETGLCAAATSTGGVSLKLPGRMGDTPVPGAGTYASELGAASATGEGEGMLRTLATKRAIDLLDGGMNPRDVARAVVSEVKSITGKVCGLILITREGDIARHHNAKAMPTAWVSDAQEEVSVSFQ